MDVVELIFVRPAPVVMFAPLGVIPDGLPRIPVEVEVEAMSFTLHIASTFYLPNSP